MEHRLRVDWIKCDGYGLCGDLAPDLIELDDWRYPIVDPGPVDPALMDEVRRAVDCCPMKALVIENTSVDGRAANRGLVARLAFGRAAAPR